MNPASGLLIAILFVYPYSLIPLAVESAIIKVPEDYSSIQQAIDEASAGDVIRVASGTYVEKVSVTKPLTLTGDGPENTVITLEGTDETAIVSVLKVLADNVEIRGFTITGGTYGIFLWHCSGTLLSDNVMSGNKWNFGVWGDTLSHFVHDIDSSNLVEGKPIYFWINENSRRVPSDAGYVVLVNSTNITAENLRLASNEQGVLLVNTRASTVRNVTIAGNDKGISLRMSNDNLVTTNNLISINWQAIYLLSSHNNTLTENTICNGAYGLYAQNSSGNSIYHNNLIDANTSHYALDSSNTWDHDGEGNYWSDYEGEDIDGDSIGDTLLPHLGVDHYPLMKIFDRIVPLANAGGNQTAFKNTAILFNASRSSDNIGIISFNWAFGDGSNATGITATHVYNATGVYTVTLTVADASGNTAADIILIDVVDLPVPFPWWIALGLAGTVAMILVTFYLVRRHTGVARIKDKR